MTRYLLAGPRHGWKFDGLRRVDLPPNANGHRYTEFRRPDGSVQAICMTDMLIE